MIEGTNTVKLCAKGFESHPTGIDLHRSFGKAVEETCSAASGAVGRLDAYRMEMRKRRFENRHEFSTLHGDPRNCAF